MTATQFQTGKAYSCRSIGDHDCVFTFTILRRTAQTVTIQAQGHEVTRKVRLRDGAEEIDPLGRYSMSPVLRADAPSSPAAAQPVRAAIELTAAGEQFIIPGCERAAVAGPRKRAQGNLWD